MRGSALGFRGSAVGVAALAIALAAPAHAQDAPAPTPGPAERESSGQDFDRSPEGAALAKPAKRPTFKLARWLEDWRPLADPLLRTDPFDPLKYIPLAADGSAHLTLSGQLREQVVGQHDGLFATSSDVWALHRLYVGADLHLGEARLLAEIGNAVAIDRKGGPAPTDEDRLDLQLLFADWRFQTKGIEWVARIGRQELAFDPTQRFVGVREGPNLRQAYDAVRINARSGSVHLSAFAGRPVAYRPGVFDDPRDQSLSFKGIYLARTRVSSWLSLYLYDYHRAQARFGNVAGPEHRVALGSRIADRIGGFDIDVEAMVQHGSLGPAKVRAWALASLAGWTFQSLPWHPRLGVQIDVASGDRDPGDQRVGTFNPLFYKGSYFTEAPIGTMANVRHAKLSLSLRPSKADTVSLSVADLARMRVHDLVYIAPLIPQPLSAGDPNRRIGGYVQGLVSHSFGPHLSLSAEAAHFVPDAQLRAVGAHRVNFAKATANFLF